MMCENNAFYKPHVRLKITMRAHCLSALEKTHTLTSDSVLWGSAKYSSDLMTIRFSFSGKYLIQISRKTEYVPRMNCCKEGV